MASISMDAISVITDSISDGSRTIRPGTIRPKNIEKTLSNLTFGGPIWVTRANIPVTISKMASLDDAYFWT